MSNKNKEELNLPVKLAILVIKDEGNRLVFTVYLKNKDNKNWQEISVIDGEITISNKTDLRHPDCCFISGGNSGNGFRITIPISIKNNEQAKESLFDWLTEVNSLNWIDIKREFKSKKPALLTIDVLDSSKKPRFGVYYSNICGGWEKSFGYGKMMASFADELSIQRDLSGIIITIPISVETSQIEIKHNPSVFSF